MGRWGLGLHLEGDAGGYKKHELSVWSYLDFVRMLLLQYPWCNTVEVK